MDRQVGMLGSITAIAREIIQSETEHQQAESEGRITGGIYSELLGEPGKRRKKNRFRIIQKGCSEKRVGTFR